MKLERLGIQKLKLIQKYTPLSKDDIVNVIDKYCNIAMTTLKQKGLLVIYKLPKIHQASVSL